MTREQALDWIAANPTPPMFLADGSRNPEWVKWADSRPRNHGGVHAVTIYGRPDGEPFGTARQPAQVRQ